VHFLPEETVTPSGPVVVPLTRPFAALTELDRPVVAVPRPLLDRATVQLPPERELLPVTTVLLEPPELPALAELLEVCARTIKTWRRRGL
jgi:hypothetical protein